MKKVGSILTIALMAFGSVAFVVENTANEFEFMNDLSKMLACDDCSHGSQKRDPPNNMA